MPGERAFDADAVGGEILGGELGEVDDGGFGGAVGRVGLRADLSGDGRDQEDRFPRGLAREERGNEGMDGVDHTHKGDIEDRPQSEGSRFQNGNRSSPNRPRPRRRGGRRARPRPPRGEPEVRDVDGDGADAVRSLFFHAGQGDRIQIEGENPGTRLEKARAMARPMPLAAPVMATVCPVRESFMSGRKRGRSS